MGNATAEIPPAAAAPTMKVPEAAALVGISTWAAYKAIAEGTWPTPVLRIGRTILIPRRPLLDALGVTADS
jgi:hypothetical protein